MSISRNISVDIARGIAIIAVVFGHLGNAQINRVVFTFHLPIFWLITGYFSRDGETLSVVVKKRFRTLLVPYYTSCIVITTASCIFQILKGHPELIVERLKFWGAATLYAAGDPYTEPFVIISIGAIWFLWASFWGNIFLHMVLKLKPVYRAFAVAILFALGYYTRAICWFPLSIQAGCCSTFFMYVGYLIKEVLPVYERASAELKTSLIMISVGAWINFMMQFQSFWLVHSDIGRGILDVIGSLCGCYVLMMICKEIEKRFQIVGRGLAFCGRYSILMLLAHHMELSFFPWYVLNDPMNDHGYGRVTRFIIRMSLKFLWIIGATVILSRINWVRKLFGMKLYERKRRRITDQD